MLLIAAIVLSSILYWLLQSREDAKADAQGQPRASLGRRVGLWLVLIAVVTVVVYMAQSAMGGASEAATVIREEVTVGMPPFK